MHSECWFRHWYSHSTTTPDRSFMRYFWNGLREVCSFRLRTCASLISLWTDNIKDDCEEALKYGKNTHGLLNLEHEMALKTVFHSLSMDYSDVYIFILGMNTTFQSFLYYERRVKVLWAGSSWPPSSPISHFGGGNDSEAWIDVAAWQVHSCQTATVNSEFGRLCLGNFSLLILLLLIQLLITLSYSRFPQAKDLFIRQKW